MKMRIGHLHYTPVLVIILTQEINKALTKNSPDENTNTKYFRLDSMCLKEDTMGTNNRIPIWVLNILR